jgi:hypothetical protein
MDVHRDLQFAKQPLCPLGRPLITGDRRQRALGKLKIAWLNPAGLQKYDVDFEYFQCSGIDPTKCQRGSVSLERWATWFSSVFFRPDPPSQLVMPRLFLCAALHEAAFGAQLLPGSCAQLPELV